MIARNEIINAADRVLTNVSMNVMSNVAINVTSSVSVNFQNKKVRYKMNCYILHMILLVVILLFLIVIISYDYAKDRPKQKRISIKY